MSINTIQYWYWLILYVTPVGAHTGSGLSSNLYQLLEASNLEPKGSYPNLSKGTSLPAAALFHCRHHTSPLVPWATGEPMDDISKVNFSGRNHNYIHIYIYTYYIHEYWVTGSNSLSLSHCVQMLGYTKNLEWFCMQPGLQKFVDERPFEHEGYWLLV